MTNLYLNFETPILLLKMLLWSLVSLSKRKRFNIVRILEIRPVPPFPFSLITALSGLHVMLQNRCRFLQCHLPTLLPAYVLVLFLFCKLRPETHSLNPSTWFQSFDIVAHFRRSLAYNNTQELFCYNSYDIFNAI